MRSPYKSHLVGCAALAVFLALSIASCATSQKIPSSSYAVLVLDEETGLPIAGAQVRLMFDGVSQNFSTTPIMTDREGKATLVISEQVLPLRFGDSYFAGGYFRRVTSRKEGFKDGSYTEGPNGFSSQPLVVKQREIRNRFGSVRFTRFSVLDTKRVLAVFDILDGPRAGERLVLPLYSAQADSHFLGRKYYLNNDLSSYEEKYKRSPNTAFSLTNGFWSADRDYPYSP